ncbi:2Fe-2S iron-sulfur cluster-binding protein [Chondromyces apiculatus]|uniref:Ferredoxin / FAD-dependent pyridine nucleotide-disulfide oxidoreductase n=1 Tax=Chondromyces apiculatus DSM 436 TaxID=1192034 RepID=A0A017SUF6_9BACT|nr:2Fe-2S iron-sulfur cluster-binding protein [Chondromyces apiculatus]EYF00412.1 Ferredoxin / FAD-dependent pyridine nucleotide-disulfide oxidoreductase [Chondromyces apiculatus DSM 436]
MLRRTRALRDPVTITIDGDPVPAERGEPLAVALLASDNLRLARSPKLHRPRGPSCLRGGCDGCLARVDGVPNVMTCTRPALGGEQIETQNVLGSRNADLLRVTDWFFPNGLDHHHLMAGIPGLQDVMQSFAQKVAGLGRLPTSVEEPHPARRLDVDAAVVGGGPAGVAVASRLARQGLRVALVHDGLSLCADLEGARATSPRFPHRAAEVLAAHPLEGVEVLLRHVAAGVYLGEILAAGDAGALVIRARARIFATGAHDGMAAFPGNDLPGILSARALCRVLACGITPDGPVVIAGEGFWADEAAARLGSALGERVPLPSLLGVRGSSEVRGVFVKEGTPPRRRTVKAVALALSTPGAPAFEVAAQAGAEVQYRDGAGYTVVVDARGRAGDGLWAVGECTGAPPEPGALLAAARITADDVLTTARAVP